MTTIMKLMKTGQDRPRGPCWPPINDASTGAEASILIFGKGIDRSNVKLRLGSLLIDAGAGDAVHIQQFDPDDPLANPAFDHLFGHTRRTVIAEASAKLLASVKAICNLLTEARRKACV